MSDHGSNVSIEEIGPEDLAEIKANEGAEVLIPEPKSEVSATSMMGDSAADDPPLENLMPNASDPPVAESVVVDESANVHAVTESAPAEVDAPAVEPIEIIEEVPREPLPNPSQSSAVSVRPTEDDDGEEDDDDIDETLTERLIGLTEMFPDFLTNGTVSLVKNSWAGTKHLYGFSRSAAWIFFSTASILFMPVMIETERLSIMDQQKQQKTQMLLGPGVASSGAPSLGPPPI